MADWTVAIPPIWILSVGAAAGLILLLLLGGASLLLSRIPFLSSLAEEKIPRWIIVGVITAALFVLAVPFILLPAFARWRATDADDAIVNLLMASLIVLALSIGLALTFIVIIWRRAADEMLLAVREGVLQYVSILIVFVASFSLIGMAVVDLRFAEDTLTSLTRLPFTGTSTQSFQIPARSGKPGDTTIEEHLVKVDFRGKELRELVFNSNQPLEVSFEPLADLDIAKSALIDVPADRTSPWRTHEQLAGTYPEGPIKTLYVRNLGPSEATLNLTVVTTPIHPEVIAIPITAISIAVFFLLYMIQRTLMPKLSAVALATFKSEVAQLIFVLVLIVGACFMVISIYIPYNTFGEDIKMLKDAGLTAILVLSIFVAVWGASKSVAEEVENRTALTVLSKPVGRRAFILGKFFGIVWTVALLFCVLSVVFLFVVAYKPVYDARESALEEATWQLCYSEMVLIVPGLLLAFMEAVVFASISVAISTRLQWLANIMICAAIYVLGHLTPLIVQSSYTEFEPVVFVGRLIATIFPVLDHFNIQAAVAGGAEVPLAYLGWAFVYCLLYGTIAMLLSLVLFEDRDMP